MRAMLLRKPGRAEEKPLAFERVDEPTPAPDEVLVRVGACGVCRTDLHVVEGELPMVRSPLVPGHQVVGVVESVGAQAKRFSTGERVGIAWLHDTCGRCSRCADERNRENLCNAARFTGWTVDGGYAEYAVVPEAFAYRIPDDFSTEQAAPLLCAGIVGYRALKLSGIRPGQRLGLYGFGASAHIAIQIARKRDCETYVFTRSESNRRLAEELGAAWVGGAGDAAGTRPPPVDASIIFAPSGPLVLDALANVNKGGTVVTAGIYMSALPAMDYAKHLYHEKTLRSVSNATRRDGAEFLALAAEIPLRTTTTVFPLEEANDALQALKSGRISGAAVLTC